MIRKICSKRARKLRKRGEYVWWSREHQSLVWDRSAPKGNSKQ